MKTLYRAAVLIAALSAAPTWGVGEDFELRWTWFQPHDFWDVGVVGAGDFDGDQVADILVPACGTRCWVVMTKGGKGYRQLSGRLPRHEGFDLLRVGTAAGHESVVLAARSLELEISAFASGKVETRFVELLTEAPRDLAIGDLDANGDLELLVLDEIDLFVHDFASGEHLTTKFGFGGTDLDLGQLDGDAPLEVAIATGAGSCWGLDGTTLLVDWGAPSGCGRSVVLADLTPDATQELITDSGSDSVGYSLAAFDPPSTTSAWSVGPLSGSPLSLAAADVTADSGDEILVLPDFSADPSLRRASDGAQLAAYEEATDGFGILADVDGDGRVEAVLAGRSYDEYGWLRIFDAGSSTLELELPSFELNSAVDAGDLDGDGDRELVAGSRLETTSGSPDNVDPALALFGGLDGGGPVIRKLASANAFNGQFRTLELTEANGQPGLDVCTGATFNNSSIGCYSTLELEEIWSIVSTTTPGDLLVGDLAANWIPDLVVSRNGGGESSYVSNYRADFGWLQWQTPNRAPDVTSVGSLCHGEFELLTGEKLVVLGGWLRSFAVLNPATGAVLDKIPSSQSNTALVCVDLDEDGRIDMLGGDSAGKIGTIDPGDGTWLDSIAELDSPVLALTAGDFLGLGEPQVAALTDSGIVLLNQINGHLIREFEGDFAATGFFEGLDLDGDGRLELVWQGSSGMLVVFGRPAVGETLFHDGFNTGNAAAWSRSPL